MRVQCSQIRAELSLWITAAPTVSSQPTEGNGGPITKKRLHFIPGLLWGFLPWRGIQLPSSPGMPGCFPRGAGGGSPGDNGSHYNRCPCDPRARSKGNGGGELHFIIARANVEPCFWGGNFTNLLEILPLSTTCLTP